MLCSALRVSVQLFWGEGVMERRSDADSSSTPLLQKLHYPVSSRPVAQEQSARLISGRPRSVTARDDHPLDGVVSLHAWLKPRRCRCDSDSSGQYKRRSDGGLECWSIETHHSTAPLLDYPIPR